MASHCWRPQVDVRHFLKAIGPPMASAIRMYHCPVTTLEACTVTFVISGSSPPKSLKTFTNTGHDERDQADQDHQREAQDDDRVGHRALDLAAQLVVLLELVGDPVQRGLEHAAGLTGAHHGDVERREDLRVLGERVGERQAGLDVLAHGADGVLELLVLELVLEHVERAQEGHARGDHGRQLARHDRQLGRLDAPEA